MKRISGASVFLAILLTCFSCTVHDPSFESVERPKINVENSVITGLVTDFHGNILANATITVNGKEIHTDANGIYRYEIPEKGDYELSASYPGKITKTASVAVPSVEVTQTFIQNFVLPEYKIIIIQTGETEEQTETIPDNEPEGTMTVTASVTIEETHLPEDAYLMLIPVYSKQEGEDLAKSQTKAASVKVENKMLVGAVITCSDPSITELATEAKMKFDVEKEVQSLTKLMMFDLKTEEWVEIPYESHDYEIVFDIKQLTTYGVFGDVNVSVEETSKPITDFKPQSYWDNYYGKDILHIGEVTYTTKIGLILDRKQGVDQLRALLLEKLAQDYGLGNEQDVTATYNVNTDLPVGTALEITGSQNYLSVIYEMNGKSVHADVCGTSAVSGKSYNRVHTGGGNYTNY